MFTAVLFITAPKWKQSKCPSISEWMKKRCYVYVFFSSHVRMWELDHKEGWAPKNWCFQTVILEKTLESPLDCKEIKPVNPKRNKPWIFIGRTDAEAPILGHLMWRADSLEKTLMLGKIEGRRRRGRQRMRQLEGITNSMDVKSEQALGVGDGQGSLVCCSPWDHKELDTTEQLNWICCTEGTYTIL